MAALIGRLGATGRAFGKPEARVRPRTDGAGAAAAEPQLTAPTVEGRSMQTWEYAVVPLADAARVTKRSAEVRPERLNELGAQGWEAVGLSLKRGDLVAWPVVLLKRPVAGPAAPRP